jgi:hypothetical protein
LVTGFGSRISLVASMMLRFFERNFQILNKCKYVPLNRWTLAWIDNNNNNNNILLCA